MFTPDQKKAFKKEVEDMVDEKVKDMPIRLIVNGRIIDCDNINYDGGKIRIEINCLLHSTETNESARIQFYQEKKE